MLAAGVNVDPLGVVARVGQDGVKQLAFDGLAKRPLEMQDIRPRSASRHGRENEMVSAIDQQADLRKMAICHARNAFVAAGAAAHEIVADVVGLEAAAVEGGQIRDAADEARAFRELQRFVEQPVGAVFFRSRSAAF